MERSTRPAPREGRESIQRMDRPLCIAAASAGTGRGEEKRKGLQLERHSGGVVGGGRKQGGKKKRLESDGQLGTEGAHQLLYL